MNKRLLWGSTIVGSAIAILSGGLYLLWKIGEKPLGEDEMDGDY
jgi:hypothetical protein